MVRSPVGTEEAANTVPASMCASAKYSLAHVLFISTACSSSSPCSTRQTSVLAQVQKFYKDVQQRQQLEQEQWRAEGEDTISPPVRPVVSIPGLLATLRGYQAQALAWMLQKEGVTATGRAEESSCELHVLWRKLPVNCVMSAPARPVYFNPYTARLETVWLHLSCMQQLVSHL